MTRINCQKIHSNISYTIKELSYDLDVSEKQCSRWIDNGLKTVAKSRKPIFIMGSDVKEFLRDKDSKKKIGKLKRNQFYCLHCKGPRRAKRGSIKKLKDKKIGLCYVCNGKMSKIFKPYQQDYQIPLFPT